MIGHFLSTLTTEQEDRVLTMPMAPRNAGQASCLVAICIVFAPDRQRYSRVMSWMWPARVLMGGFNMGVPTRYDYLCDRFGAHRINSAIRQRILSNRLWRTLSGSAVVQQEATP